MKENSLKRLEESISEFMAEYGSDRAKLVKALRKLEEKGSLETIKFIYMIRHPRLYENEFWAAAYGIIMAFVAVIFFILGLILVVPIYSMGELPNLISQLVNYTASFSPSGINLLLIILGYACIAVALLVSKIAGESLRMSGKLP